MVKKLGIRAALPASAVVRLSVDRFSDEIFSKSVVFLQYFSDADRLLPTYPETKVALADFLPAADFALKLFPATPELLPSLQSLLMKSSIHLPNTDDRETVPAHCVVFSGLPSL